ncbi:MAG: GntR family transcriptional regulator [Rhodanobacter sp.]
MHLPNLPKPPASQTTRILLELRDLIVGGELAPGERLSELVVVQRLGASRTPVRAALQRLAEEGLLEALASGGYAIKAFSEDDVRDAIELRGTLEGMAARRAAEQGAAPSFLKEAKKLLSSIDNIIAMPELSSADFQRYVLLNERFHGLVISMTNSKLLAREYERVTRLPFASPSSFVMAQAELPKAQLILTLAQDHHYSVIEAIELRQGERAESLMREHARLAHRNFRSALRDQRAIDSVHGCVLLQSRRTF